MLGLTIPTEEQASSFTRELDYEDRFAGYLYKASGQMGVTVYSLEQALGFLAMDNTEATVEEGAQLTGGNVAVASRQPGALAGWVREGIGDAELADAIEAAVADIPEESGYPPLMRAMREVMNERFLQCMEVLGIEPGASADTEVEPDKAK